MKTKVLFCFTIICFLVCSCSSTNISYAKKNEIETKLNIALENCSKRSKENSMQFEQTLRYRAIINKFSNTLIQTLLDNEYIEIDFNEVFNIEIEKVLMRELFHREADVFLGSTITKIFEINGIDYFLFYMDKNEKNYPNLYTVVYVDDSERKKIRVFYKINYYLEYEVLTDGISYYKAFY